MTDDKEEWREITMEQWLSGLRGKQDFIFIDLPLAPEHTDEEYDYNDRILNEMINERDHWVSELDVDVVALKARIKELEAQLHARGCLTCDRFMVGWLSEECSKGCHAPDWKFWRARK